MEIVCYVCGAQYDQFLKLQRHCRKEHKTRGYILCCNRKYYRRCLILQHLKFHLNPVEYG